MKRAILLCAALAFGCESYDDQIKAQNEANRASRQRQIDACVKSCGPGRLKGYEFDGWGALKCECVAEGTR